MNTLAPSPTWRKQSPVFEGSPVKQRTDSTTDLNGAGVVEEASAVQPMSVKQRGTRLSFLGGRRKESKDSNVDNVFSISEEDSASSPMSHPGSQRGMSKDNRRSFFRGPTHETIITAKPYAQAQPNGESHTPDWVQSVARKSSELVGIMDKGTEKHMDNGSPRRGSVRKRLSMLKLGSNKKGRPNGAMGGVDEE